MKKYLMILLSLCFVMAMVLAVVIFSKRSKPVSVSIPFLNSQETPTPTLFLTQTADPRLMEIENDLKMIKNDIQKVKDDSRLFPPSFIFDLGEIK